MTDESIMLASIAAWKAEQVAPTPPPKTRAKYRKRVSKIFPPLAAGALKCAKCPRERAKGSKQCCITCLERKRAYQRITTGYKGAPQGRKPITA